MIMVVILMIVVILMTIVVMDSDQVIGEELNHVEEAEDHPVSEPSEKFRVIRYSDIGHKPSEIFKVYVWCSDMSHKSSESDNSNTRVSHVRFLNSISVILIWANYMKTTQ